MGIFISTYTNTTTWTFNLAGLYTVEYTTDDWNTKTELTSIIIAQNQYRVLTTFGQDAFVYEHTDVATLDSDSSKLTKYSDDSVPSAVNVIAATDGKFSLTEEVVNGQYGKYVIDGAYNDPNFVYIWYPELSPRAELTASINGATFIDSICIETVNKDVEVTARINAPKVSPAFYNAGYSAYAKIVFTTPASGKTTTFGTGIYATPFEAVELEATQTIADWTEAGVNVIAGTGTAQEEYTSTRAFSDYAKKSNTISFILQSSSLTITAAKDSVVRSNPFAVTIQGDSQKKYGVFIEGVVPTDVNPVLQANQDGWQKDIYWDNFNNPTGAFFKTDASGKRTIQYNTAADTEDKTYTIKVNALESYDTTTGVAVYYIGNEIKLTGTNTDSSNVFRFLTGQNLLENGIVLKDLPKKIAANPVLVKTDNTWEYKWDTSQIALDTGAYTIYATSRLTNGKASDKIETASTLGELDTDGKDYAVKLSDSEYATISVNLKQPFLSAVPSRTTRRRSISAARYPPTSTSSSFSTRCTMVSLMHRSLETRASRCTSRF